MGMSMGFSVFLLVLLPVLANVLPVEVFVTQLPSEHHEREADSEYGESEEEMNADVDEYVEEW